MSEVGATRGTRGVRAPARGMFVSYAEPDRAWVQGYLLDGLRQAGVDVVTDADFRAGVPVLDEMERLVRSSRHIVLVITPAWVANCSTSMVELLGSSYGLETSTWPVVPLLLAPTEDLPLRIQMLTSLDATAITEWPRVIERLCASANQPAPPPTERPPCPYPGMAALGLDDAERFYGRTSEVEDALARLRAHPLLAVVGPSGSGKSSLTLAGVAATLREAGTEVVVMRPGREPLHTLRTTTVGVLASTAHPALLVVDQLEELFAPDVDGGDRFCREVAALAKAPGWSVVLTLRADYYAALMTSPLWDQVERRRLEVVPPRGQALRQMIVRPAQEVRVYVEAPLVERLVADAADEPGVLPLLQETLVLLWQRMERRFLPVAAYDTLVLPSLKYGDPECTGLRVALARVADEAMAELAPQARAVARRIFLRLVQFVEGRAEVRRQQTVGELRQGEPDQAVFYGVLERLTAARLLTPGQGVAEPARPGPAPTTTSAGRREPPDSTTVDLAHEALISGWPELRRWISERRGAEVVRRRLQADAEDWVDSGRGARGLLDEFEVAEAERWLGGEESLAVGVSDDVRALVAASAAALAATALRQRRVARALRILALGLAALVVVTALVANSARHARDGARKARDAAQAQSALALSGEIALTARDQPLDHLDAALLLAQEAVTVRSTPRSRGALLTALLSNPRLRRMAQLPHAGSGLAMSPDRRRAAIIMDEGSVTREEGSVTLWDTSTARSTGWRQLVPGGVRAVAFSPDGRTVAASGVAGQVLRWDADSGAAAGPPIRVHTGVVRALAYSPRGDVLATGGVDGKVVLSHLTGDQAPIPLAGHHDWVEALAFTPDGRWLLSGSGATEHRATDTRILVWDLDGRLRRPRTLGRLPDAVRALAVDRSGRFAASADAVGGVVIWDLRRSRAVHRLRSGRDRVFSVCFSPDGGTVVAAGRDGLVRSWDVRTGRAVLPPLQGHGDSVRGVGFAAADRLITVGHEDARLMIWDVAARTSSRLDAPLPGDLGPTRTVAVDDGSGRVAAGDVYGHITVVDRARPAEPVEIQAGTSVWSLAFAPDGGLLAGTFGRSLGLWDTVTGRPVVPPIDTGDHQASAVAFAPDGRSIVSGGSGQVVRRWDLRLHRLGAPLVGHRNWVTALAFRRDGTLASAGADGQVWLWRPDGQGMALSTPSNQLTAVAWTPDGSYVVSGDSVGNVVRWLAPAHVPDASSGSPPVLEHQNSPPLGRLVGAVQAVAVTGGIMVTTDVGGTAYLWDVQGSLPRLVGPIARREQAYGAAVGTKGTVVVGFGDGARRMDTDPTSWRRTACVLAGRNLTRDEFGEAVRGRAYHRTCPALPEPLRYLTNVPVAQ